MTPPTDRIHLTGPTIPPDTDLANTWLVINRLQGFDVAAPLDFLEHLPLHALHIVDANKRDIAVVQKLSTLKHLILGDTTQPLDLSQLSDLRSLSLFWTKATTLPPASTPIASLDLRHFKAPTKDLSTLPAYATLHTLRLTHGNARTLRGLERFPALRNLSLNTMMRLTSIDDADRLNLELLEINSCAAIRERKLKFAAAAHPPAAGTTEHPVSHPASHPDDELGEG